MVVLRTDADNLNPHKGDASRYFLHQVEPDVARNAGKPIQVCGYMTYIRDLVEVENL